METKYVAIKVEQVAGSHYSSPYQHWDFVYEAGLGYFEAQLTRYISRAFRKNGVEDLKKAISYVDKMLTLLSDTPNTLADKILGRSHGLRPTRKSLQVVSECMDKFFETYDFEAPSETQREAIVLAFEESCMWFDCEDLKTLRDSLKFMVIQLSQSTAVVSGNDGSDPVSRGYVNQDQTGATSCH
jgi:hypothetical protein